MSNPIKTRYTIYQVNLSKQSLNHTVSGILFPISLFQPLSAFFSPSAFFGPSGILAPFSHFSPPIALLLYTAAMQCV